MRRERWCALLLALWTGCSSGDAVGNKERGAAQGATPKESAGADKGSSPTEDFGNPASTGGSSGQARAGSDAAAGSSAPGPSLNAAAVLRGSCATAAVESELLPSNVLFVLDRSGSMACNPPPTTDSQACEAMPERAAANEASKWEITTAALNAAIAALPPSTSVGLSYFSNDDDCGVSSMPSVPLALNSTSQQAAIANSLGTVQPGGGTPLVGATILAYKYLHQAALSGAVAGNQFVVVITDGAQSEACSNPPVCDDAASCTALLSQQEVPKAAGPGVDIRTFVIGVPGSEPARGALSSIATNGGTAPAGCDVQAGACHFDMTMVSDLGQALGDALAQISGRAVSCELDLPVPEEGALDLQRVNVVYTPPGGGEPQVVPQDKHAACDDGANGWQYGSNDTKIQLCGSACETVRGASGARIDVVLGCPVQGPL